MDQIIEQWRAVPQWEGFYEVSDQGRVRSLDRVVVMIDGKKRLHRGGLRALTQNKRTRYYGVLFYRDGRPTAYDVHGLVLLAFAGEPLPGQEGCHCNGIRTDNRLENLRWDTRSANHADRLLHGTDQHGENNVRAILSNAQVLEVYRSAEAATTIARRLGCSSRTISAIRTGQNWKSVTGHPS
jgi:NUMOD4 motif.